MDFAPSIQFDLKETLMLAAVVSYVRRPVEFLDPQPVQSMYEVDVLLWQELKKGS